MKMNAKFCAIPFLDAVLYRLHHLIKTKSTGTPQQLASRLHCSASTVYTKIKILKDFGFPIKYCPVRCCYYYDGDVSIDLIIRINGEETQKIVGGNTINKTEDFFLLQNYWSSL